MKTYKKCKINDCEIMGIVKAEDWFEMNSGKLNYVNSIFLKMIKVISQK